MRTPDLGAEAVGPKLTPKRRDLLRQEMAVVLAESQNSLSAVVMGDHATVAEHAQQIHGSFILRQLLTEQDRTDQMNVAVAGVRDGCLRRVPRPVRKRPLCGPTLKPSVSNGRLWLTRGRSATH